MDAVSEFEALDACRTLFGGAADPVFLRELTSHEVKRAFRQKALLLHPDRFAGAGPALRRRQTERFQAMAAAYEALSAWCDRRDTAGPSTPSTPPTAAPDRPAGTAGVGPSPGDGPSHRWAGRVSGPTDGSEPISLRPGEGLGSYLRRRGAISYEHLVAALAWQQRGRPRIGELAVRWGWLTPAQVQQVLASRRCAPRFAERAVELGLLTPFRARTLLRFQQSRQRRLGDYFVEQGVLPRAEVERLAAAHKAGAPGAEVRVATPVSCRAASRA